MRRSRAGCIDCRRSKVKCDELKPGCGTCARRGKECHGYPGQQLPKQLKWASTNISVDGPPLKRRRATFSSPLKEEEALKRPRLSVATSHEDVIRYPTALPNVTADFDPGVIPQTDCAIDGEPVDENVHSAQQGPLIKRHSSGGELMTRINPLDFFQHPSSPFATRTLSPFFSSEVKPEITQGILMYFARHPAELVIGSEPCFIREMNSHVLGVLYSDVEAVGDGLSSIGQIYLHSQGAASSLALALSSRAKTLERIRKWGRGLEGFRMEQVMSMILALVSMELIDTTYQPTSSSLYALHSAAAAMINHSQSIGSTLSPTAQYLIRALAREDIIMSLIHRRQLLIPTSVWLDEDCLTDADRFMGFTMTLTPLLEELCALSEDMKSLEGSEYPDLVNLDPGSNEDACTVETRTTLVTRADNLRLRISTWRPPFVPTFSGSASRKFFLHASMYRSAARLYLHRILHPHDNYPEHDNEALSLAYEIFAYLSTDPRDNRLALFPIFLASCEFQTEEDRKIAEDIFDQVGKSRGTHSTSLTGRFVKDRVWRARDSGEEWAWMRLVDRWPGECVPI